MDVKSILIILFRIQLHLVSKKNTVKKKGMNEKKKETKEEESQDEQKAHKWNSELDLKTIYGLSILLIA